MPEITPETPVSDVLNGMPNPINIKRDWPPTWPRDAAWACPFNVAECPSEAWHYAHIHFRRFANLPMQSADA